MTAIDPRQDYAARLTYLKSSYLQPKAERPASPTRGVHHLALICSDAEQTIRFYQDLLGFPLIEVMENRDYRGSTHIFFDLGNGNLLAFFDFPGLGLEQAVEANGGVQHIAISVTEANHEEFKRRLEAAGVPYLGPDRGVYNSIYFRDPDGIQIELLREPLLQMDERHLGEDD